MILTPLHVPLTTGLHLEIDHRGTFAVVTDWLWDSEAAMSAIRPAGAAGTDDFALAFIAHVIRQAMKSNEPPSVAAPIRINATDLLQQLAERRLIFSPLKG